MEGQDEIKLSYSWEEYTNDDGEIRKIFRELYYDGSVCTERHYRMKGKKAIKDGISRTWYRNGVLKRELNYKDNKRNGLSQKFHDTGNTYLIGNFVNGQRVGTWNTYNKTGGLVYSKCYS